MHFLTCRSLIAFNWWMCLLFSAVALGGLALFRPNIPWVIALGFIPFSLIGAAIAFYYSRRNDERPAKLGAAFAQMIVFVYAGLLLSYVFASLNLPYRDALFMKMDLALGLDWMRFVTFINQSLTAVLVLAYAYSTIGYQLAILLFALALAGQEERLIVYICALGISILITVILSGLLPAQAYGGFLQLPVDQFTFSRMSEEHQAFLKTLEILRARSGEPLTLHGIVTFPSFHTTSAMLFIWGMWRVPVLRWVSLIVNTLMIIATPVFGYHYFVDLIGGVAIMIFAIWAAKSLQHYYENKSMLAAQV